MRNKHSIGRRFLALLLCALMMVGLMPTTALAATTVSNATELQNAIKNAKSGDTIQLTGNITFNNSSQITTIADFYQNWEVLTYKVTKTHFAERCPSVAGIPMGPWKDLYSPPTQIFYDYELPKELKADDSRGLRVTKDGRVYDGNTETRVREHGDATTYMLIKDKNLTIDLNGYTINAAHDAPYFSALLVTGSSSVTIMGSRSGGGITSNGTAVTVSGTNAKITVNGGSFKGDTTAVSVIDFAALQLNGGTFTGAGVTERAFKSAVDIELDKEWEQRDTHGDGFGYETIHTITTYKGTAFRTVPCGTLYSDRGNIKISGGIFDTPPKESYVVNTHCILQKDDGTCEVLPKTDARFVAQVYRYSDRAIYCTSLNGAIKLAQDGYTVLLMRDISGEQILENNSTYTLSLGGYTINGNVTVKTGNVTIRNGTINYTSTGNALKTEGNSAVLTADCTVNASNGTALSAGYGSGGGTVNAIGGTYTGKLGTAAGGTLTITGGRYKNDPSAYLAEGFYAILDSERYYAVTDSPFIEIWNKDDLMAFAQKVNGGDYGANAVLMADIDMSGVTWTPMGTSANTGAYIGTFNGNGHSIKNFTSTKGGLFDYIGKGGVVSDVTIASGNISGGDIGAIANDNVGTIRGCFNYASVTGRLYVGGITSGGGTIEQCGNYGTITGEQRVGGISGQGGIIEQCWNYGTITGEKYVGGIVGNYGSPNNCYNVGKIRANNAEREWNGYEGWEYYSGAGGISGSAHLEERGYSSKANNCFNYGTISAKDNYFVPVSLNGTNNWHLDTTANGSAVPGYTSKGSNKSVFASGDLAYTINGYKEEGVWYQNIGEDPYPVLDPTHARVYWVSGQYVNYTYQGIGYIKPVTVSGGTPVAEIISQLQETAQVTSDKPGYAPRVELSWDTSPLSDYDPDNWEEQTFTLKGTAYVTGLKNGGKKDVSTTVTVNPVTLYYLSTKTGPKTNYNEGDSLDLSGMKVKAVYNDVNRTAVELSYDSPGVTCSLEHGTVLNKQDHNGHSILLYYGGKRIGWGTAGELKILSTDNTIKNITVGGTGAVLGDNGEYIITLPKGSSLPEESNITVTPTDSSVKSVTKSLVEGSNNYWEITVVAESGHAATYYLEVLIEGWNKDAIDSLKQAWDDMDKTWKPTQAEVQQGSSEAGDDNNLSYEMQLKAWLIQTMVERGMEIPANVTTDISFTKGPDWATAGDRHNDRDGVDGEFEFSITFTATQGSEDTHETVTFDSQSGIITATPYAAPDYTVHFNSGGGSSVADLVVKEDDVIGENAPADPTFEHYTFLGWFTQPTGGEKWDMANDKVDRDNITLYAQWELTKYKVVLPENQHGYTLTADKEEVVWNESVTFTYKLGVGYNGDDLVIKVNGEPVTLDKNGEFTVGGNVDSDIVVTVDGVINAPTYTVTIPESVNLDSKATVSAAGVNVAEGSSLYVAIGGEFTIANSNPLFKQTIGYPIQKGGQDGTQIKPDDTVLTVAGGIANNNGSQVLYFGLPTEEPKYADDYKGTVTFRIGIKDTE